MNLFNNPVFTFLVYSLLGAVYFALYRYLCFKRLKWKMLNAVWLPIIYGVALTTYGIILLRTPWFGANRTFLSQLSVIGELIAPVIVFFVLFLFFMFKDRQAAKVK